MRAQSNKNSYNLVSETPMFLDCICGLTTGELGLLGLYIKSTTSPSSTKPWKHWRYCHGRWSRLSSPFRKCANIWPTTQKLEYLTRRSATTKDQKWPHFSKASTTCLTRWNGRKTTKTAIPLLGQLAHVQLSIWSQILFNLTVIINLIAFAFFYPFDIDGPAPVHGIHFSGLCLVHVN